MPNKKIILHDVGDNVTELYPKTTIPCVDGLSNALNSKQDTLVSGTNIKTVNNITLLGSGNISIPFIIPNATIPEGVSAPNIVTAKVDNNYYKIPVTDVQINGTTIISNNVVNIATQGVYDATTNPLATMSDVPTNATFVDLTTNQTIGGQKDFNVIPRVRIEHELHDLPTGYDELEYIESTGTQYINTGVVLTNYHSIEIDYQLTSLTQPRAGIFGGYSTSRYGLIIDTSNLLEYGYGATNIYYKSDQIDTKRHLFKQEQTKVYFDNELIYTFASATFTLNINAPVGTFAYTNYTPAKAKYYRIKIWENDDLIRDLIPSKNTLTNKIGLYDIVNDIFYESAVSDNFVGGPVAVPVTYENLLTDAILADVAFSGDYNDLINKPTIPTVNNATLTIQKNGTTVSTFTANASTDVTANITVPTNTSDLNNDSGFITSGDIPQEIFWCTYGSTPYAQVKTALSNGKMPIVKYKYDGTIEGVYQLSQMYNDRAIFEYTEYDGNRTIFYYVMVRSNNSYSSGRLFNETSSNKVTSISSSSTNSQYPSAKCVYDNIENVREVITGLTQNYVCSDVTNVALNSTSNDIQLSTSLVDVNSNTIGLSSLKVGDTIYIVETDVPDRWVSNITNVNTVSDLSGTTWYLKSPLSFTGISTSKTYDISGVFGSVSSTDLRITTDGTVAIHDPNYLEIYASGEWADDTYRMISITGGTETTDTDVINWFVNNAVLVATLSKLETVKAPIQSISVNNTNIQPVLSNVNITVPTDTSDLNNDSGYITLGDVPKEIYWCTYGSTPYTDIMTAYNEGKIPAIKYVYSGSIEGVYKISQVWSDRVVFTYSDSSGIVYSIIVRSSNSYAPGRTFVETSSNKVTSISSSSTNTQYPSAKCVYDAIASNDALKSITGYDATKTQTLKNINGTFTWVDD